MQSKPDPENRAETSRISLAIEGIDLPADKEDREAVLHRIAGEIKEMVEEKEDLSPDYVQIGSGYHYPKIPTQCPQCKHDLKIRRPGTKIDGDVSNQHQVSIYCSHCGYGGGAKYNLTDIVTNKYNSERSASEYRSEVQDMNIMPEYQLYRD